MKTGIEAIPEDLWQLACAREAVIRPLAAAPHVGRAEIAAAATTLGIRRAYVYRLLAAYRRRPQTSTLVPKQRGRPQDARALDQKVEAVIHAAITGFYMTPERPRFSDLMRDIEERCDSETVDAPDYRTVRRRLKAFDPCHLTKARHGEKRAREMFGAALPQQRPRDPLGLVEIDHSPMDVIVVDEQSRLPLGRPWLSLAVDVPTRMVAGFSLSFDDPSALAVALVLTHAVLPKEAWLAEREISLPWPTSGLPDWIETDNGEEFHSRAFERGAAEYGIRLTYRPLGAPQVGGHIERWTIPYRDLGAPPITLWEHRNAFRKLNADGLKSVDEKLIFQTIHAQRELIAAARLRTRTARLAQARSNAGQPASPPALPASAPQEPASIDVNALAPFAVDDWS